MSLAPSFCLADVPELLPSAPIYDAVRAEMRRRNAEREATIRRLLERWISECEPAVMIRDGRVIGLCDHESGAIGAQAPEPPTGPPPGGTGPATPNSPSGRPANAAAAG